MNPDDVVRAMKGDRVAFGRLVIATAPAVSSIALAITRDRESARDVAQDVYLAAWAAIGRLRSPESFLPWIRQIARMVARSARRSAARRARHESDAFAAVVVAAESAVPHQTHLLVGREREAAVTSALDALPANAREVVLLFYSEGHSADQVADLIGISPAAVRKRLERARRRLREEVLRRLGEESRSLRSSSVAVTLTALAAARRPASEAALSIVAGAASAPLLAGGGAAIGLVATRRRIRELRERLHNPDAARRFTNSAMGLSLVLGVLLPLWRPRALWWWFGSYQLLVVYATFVWLPRRGLHPGSRDIVRWMAATLAGAAAVAWAMTRM